LTKTKSTGVNCLTEAKMLKELKKGSEAALEWFICRYTAYVGTIIHNIIGDFMDTADIEDVASDVFFTLWQHAGDVRPGHVQGYLAAIARNKAKNKCREMGCRIPLEDDVIVLDTETPEAQLQRKELSAAVRKSVLDMPNPDREIFLRFYFYYQTAEQISHALQINLSTVKTKLRRGREKLKLDLTNYMI